LLTENSKISWMWPKSSKLLFLASWKFVKNC
jgi:hypothetical protein